jgi:hypothetical protein
VRARTAWSLTLPVLVAGETLGHLLAHRLAGWDEHANRSQYVAYAEPLVLLCLALVVVAVAARVLAAFSGQPIHATPSRWLATLPSAAFLLQEHLERLHHYGSLDWATTFEPTVAIGVALQLPFGVLAIWLVRKLVRLAHDVGRALADGHTRRWSVVRVCRAQTIALPRVAALASGLAERAPPIFA